MLSPISQIRSLVLSPRQSGFYIWTKLNVNLFGLALLFSTVVFQLQFLGDQLLSLFRRIATTSTAERFSAVFRLVHFTSKAQKALFHSVSQFGSPENNDFNNKAKPTLKRVFLHVLAQTNAFRVKRTYFWITWEIKSAKRPTIKHRRSNEAISNV